MSSFQERFESFKNWAIKSKTCTPENLASTCFSAEETNNTDCCVCTMCNKNLEGWDSEDVPIIEHYNHRKDCIIFNLNTLEARISTFKDILNEKLMKEETVRILARQGFFVYTIKARSKYDLFCYRCGFLVTENCNIEEDYIESHFQSCRRTKKNGKFAINNVHSIFANDLISGKYAEAMKSFIYNNVYVPDDMKRKLEEIIYFNGDTTAINDSLFEKTETMLKRRYTRQQKMTEIIIDDEIKKIMDKIDEKYEECLENFE